MKERKKARLSIRVTEKFLERCQQVSVDTDLNYNDIMEVGLTMLEQQFNIKEEEICN